MQIAYFQIKGDGKRTNQDALFDGTNVHTAKLHHAKTVPTPTMPFCVAVADGVSGGPKAHLASRFWINEVAQARPNDVGSVGFLSRGLGGFVMT